MPTMTETWEPFSNDHLAMTAVGVVIASHRKLKGKIMDKEKMKRFKQYVKILEKQCDLYAKLRDKYTELILIEKENRDLCKGLIEDAKNYKESK